MAINQLTHKSIDCSFLTKYLFIGKITVLPGSARCLLPKFLAALVQRLRINNIVTRALVQTKYGTVRCFDEDLRLQLTTCVIMSFYCYLLPS